MFDVEAASEWIDRARDPAFMGDDLLGAQGQPDRFFGRQGEGLVLAVGVQALRAAEHGGQGLERDANDVVIGLLGGEGHAAGLGMKPQRHALGHFWPRIAVS